MLDSNFSQKSDIIRCIRVWNFVAHELNLRMNALNDFKQAMVECYKTAIISNYDCENPRISSLSVLTVIILPSLSRVAFNFVIMYFLNYSNIYLIFCSRSNWLTLLHNSCHFFFVSLFDYLNVFNILCSRS